MWKKLRARALLLLELCLDLSLLILFSAQAFVAACLLIYGYIPMPAEWTNKVLLEQTFNNCYIQASSFRLKLNGAIQVTELKVYYGEMSEPLLEASSTELEYTLRKDGVYQFTPTELVMSNGTLQMPAIYAPDGKRRAILEAITFHLTPTEELIRIDSFAAQHEDIRLRGSIDWPLQTRSSSGSEVPPLERFYKLIATALKEKERFSPFIQPTLEFSLTARQDKSVDVSTHLSCETLKYIHATGTNFDFKTSFKLQDGRFTPLEPLILHAKAINIPKFALSATAITAYVAKDQWSELLQAKWPDFEISAYQLSTHGVELDSPKAKISPVNFPELAFSGSTSGLKGGVAFSGKINSANRSGQLHANGNVDIFSLFPQSARTKLPKLEFGSTPYYDLSIHLDEGFQVNSTRFRIDVDDVTANGLTFDHILATGSYQDGLIDLDTALIDRGKQWIDATFSLNRSTQDFKLSLLGSALPDQYGPLLPKWWDKLFKDIDFDRNELGYGDFVIYGNTEPKSKIFFLGHASATNVTYKEARIDEGELIVRGRRNYTELHSINAKTGDGWAKGNVGFTGGKLGLVSVRYDFDSLMPLEVASKIFGSTVAGIISDFEVTQLPRITLDGAVFNNAYTEYAQLDYCKLAATIQTPITFKKTPLDHLRFTLYNRNRDTYLRDVEFGYADGDGSAQIDIRNTLDENQLRLQLSLKGANQAKAIHNLPSLDDIESQLTNTEALDPEKKRNHGQLDLNIDVVGPLDNLYGYNGYGDFTVANNQLGAIQLLGPLSKLLKNTRLNFTSFNLKQMTTSFEIAEDTLNFSDLTLDGPRTKIRGQGTLHLPDQALNMNMSVSLFENMGASNSKINTFRKFITAPLPNLLVFDLKGTMQEQKIRSRYDPRQFIPILKDL